MDKHSHRCETCVNKNCQNFPEGLRDLVQKGDINGLCEGDRCSVRTLSIVGCASHSDKLTFDSIANEIRLTDTGYVKCTNGGECDFCGKESPELYTHLSYEENESDGYACPDCAFKALQDIRMESFYYAMQHDAEHDAELINQFKKELLGKLSQKTVVECTLVPNSRSFVYWDVIKKEVESISLQPLTTTVVGKPK